MLALAGAFVRSGHKVDLLLGRAQGPLAAEVPPGVHLRVLTRASTRRLIGCMLRLPRATLTSLGRNLVSPALITRTLPDLESYLREQRPQLLISTLARVNVLAAWAVYLAGAPTRLVLREANQFSRNLNRANPFDRSLPSLARQWYPRADRVVAVSPGVREDLIGYLGLHPDHVVTILNPVDGHQIRAAAEPQQMERAGLGRNDEFVLGVGKLTPQKGFPLLIEAFARAFPDGPLKLVIAGQGAQQAELRCLAQRLGISRRVLLPGHVHQPYYLMRRTRLFVLSSLWEGCPNVLLEAMACGCPIVSTDCPSGPRELLAHGRYGRLVPTSRVDALADGMRSALQGDCPSYDPEVATAAHGVEAVAGQYIQSIGANLAARTKA